MIIDTHGHMIPPDLLNTIRKEGGKLSALRIVEDPAGLSLAFGNSKPSRPIMKGLSDLTGRLAWMDKQGIDKQVNGGWPDWFGSDMPADQGERWCRLMNEGLLSAARAEPRFVPLATLPMQDGARAGAVLKEAMAAGFRGAMISTLPRGIGSVLDAPDLDPFWQAADDTGAVIHIHPAFDAGESRVHDYGLANGVGRVEGAGRDGMIALEAPHHERQATRGDRHEHFGVLVAGDVTAHGNPRYGDNGVADPANAVGEAVIVDAALAGVEGRMNVDHRAGLVGGFPERVKVRRVEHAADTARQRRDHRAAEARRHGGLEHRGSAGAILHRQRRERHELRLGLGGGEQSVFDYPAPGLTFRRRQIVAEPVGPTAVHLLVDALLLHPGQPSRDVAQPFHDRP